MNSFLWQHVGVPLLSFMFDFLGDHLWIVAILAVLAAILVWRFLMPVVWGFNALFGLKGWVTLGVALLTFGAFGAGWRARRASVLDPSSPDYHGRRNTILSPKDRNGPEYSDTGDDAPGSGMPIPPLTPKRVPRPRKKTSAKS